MTVLELKKEIDDYIEAGGDKYCDVLIVHAKALGAVRLSRMAMYVTDVREVAYEEFNDSLGGLVIR